MTRVGRLGLGALALCVSGLTAASGPASAGEKRESKKEVRILHRGGGGYLGVRLDDVGKQDVTRLKLTEERGALVKEVVEGGPAAKAGVEQDDVILSFEDEAVASARQLTRLVAETPSGRSVSLEVIRGGGARRLPVEIGERRRASWSSALPGLDFDFEAPTPPEAPEPPEAPDAPEPPDLPLPERLLGPGWGRPGLFSPGPRKLGLGYQEISGQLARYFKLSRESGVLVTDVQEDGPAAKAGLQAGDLVLEFGGKSIRDGEDFRDAVRDAEAGKQVAVKVQREGQTLELHVTPAGRERERRRAGVPL